MQKKTSELRKELLIETSWEVCNKIGGIYTVLSTKAAELHKEFGDNLIFIGPDRGETPADFMERKTLLKSAASKMALPHGISIRVGRWKVPGQPIAVLVDYEPVIGSMNDIFGEMWRDFGVDSLHAYGDYTVSCAFAVAAATVAEALAAHLGRKPSEVIAHFDEWTTGMGLLHMRGHMPGAATVFTTHATSIGRSIAGNGKPLYDYFKGYNGDQMAGELNMEAKHSVEKRAAATADCFTTVSTLTQAECSQLLDVTPQVVTPNGFNADMVPGARKWNTLRAAGRRRLLEVASAMTGRDLDDSTMIVATSGRNEYRNKGLDLYIDALHALGTVDGIDRPVLALILVPAWVKEPNGALLESLAGRRDAGSVWPPFSTHRLNNEDGDSTFLRLLELQSRQESSRVSFMYVPCYLHGDDGVLNISYYDLLPALDAAVFASYYEPWGYTPLESIAFGIPTVTSDKSGFGRWAAGVGAGDVAESGVAVVNRNDSNYSQAADSIASILRGIGNMSAAESKKAADAARALAARADWSLFIRFYNEAYEYALKAAADRTRASK